jgi:hypothetical protein
MPDRRNLLFGKDGTLWNEFSFQSDSLVNISRVYWRKTART